MTESLRVPLTTAEVERIRNDFPILSRSVNGHPLVYLDTGATSQNPISVMEAEQEYYEQRNAAVHRGAHTLAAEATDLFEQARDKVAAFIGAADDEVVWTSNATEALNLVAYSIGNASLGRGGTDAARFRIGPGDEIVVTEMEHHANLIPWQELAARTGASLRYIPVTDNGELDMNAAAEIIGERTRVLAVAHVSNVLGTINPVPALVSLARATGADTFVVLDACQSVPHMPINVHALDVDFAAFSAHKMLGPTGVGALYGKSELLNAMPPFLTGGSMITVVTMDHAEFLPAPQRFEAGTQRVSQAIAFGAAVDYLSHIGMDRIQQWEEHLTQKALQGLGDIPGIRVLGPGRGRPRSGLVAFDTAGVHAHDVGQFLDDRGIAVRVGHHCAQPVHRRFGVTASTRASFYLYNTEAEVDDLLNAVADVRPFFGVAQTTGAAGAR